MMIKSLKNILKTKEVQRIQNNKLLRGVILVVVMLFAAFIVSVAFFPSPQSINSQLPAELQEIDKSIKEARNKTDPFVRERFIQQEARKLKLTSDEYKKLYTLRKGNSEMLPDAPHSPFDWVKWFYQDLSREQRFKVIEIWAVRIIPAFSSLTIVFGVIQFLRKIFRREKEAIYQAWQVIHTAHGQKVSGARIVALEDLQKQGESLAGLTLEEGANLSDINLSKADLSKANLRGADLSKADLRGADLRGADLSKANLRGVDLSDAKLGGADLSYADLSKANLRGAILSVADLRNTKFIGADLIGADLSVAKLGSADLSKADLRGANLSYAYLSDANLIRTDLRGADLSGSDLSDANLRGANLSDTDLIHTNLRGADLSDANLSGADLSDTDLKNAIFDKADICKTIFDGAIGLTEDQQRDLEQRGAIFDVKVIPPLTP